MNSNLKLPISLWGLLWYVIKKQKKGFIIICLSMNCWALEESCYPYFIKLIIDQVTDYAGPKDGLFATLVPCLVIFSFVMLFIELNYRVFDFLSAKIYPRFMADIRTLMHEYILGHSPGFFADNFAGAISTRIFRMPESAHRIIDLFITIFIPITMSILMSCFFLSLSYPLISLIVLLWFMLYMGVTLSFANKSSQLSIIHSKSLINLNGKVLDCINNIMNVKIFSNYSFEKKYFARKQEEELSTYVDSMRFSAFIKMILAMINTSFTFITVLVSIYCYNNSYITLGDLSMILSYHSLLKLVWLMANEIVPFFDLVGNCKEALTILNTPHEITDIQDADNLTVKEGSIVFDQVTFNYPKNKDVFYNKSIIISPLQKVGLAGLSGSGKSSFVNLILRNYNVSSGKILIDGQNIAKVTQESLRKNISLIPQDSLLFHRSVLENIRYGRSDASDAEVIEAAKHAHAHDFIEKLPEQYHSLVGERGVKISGGQKQRLAIARAILKNAPILMLDEATSALDSITERDIQASLKELMIGKTVIVIAHRLSTLVDMDRILVFDQGIVVEDGSHTELLANKETYYSRLWNMQSSNFII